MARVIPIRPLTEQDLIEAVKRLRYLMTASDSAAISLHANFEGLGAKANDGAIKARRHIEAAAAKTYDLLLEIEKTKMYTDAVKRFKALQES